MMTLERKPEAQVVAKGGSKLLEQLDNASGDFYHLIHNRASLPYRWGGGRVRVGGRSSSQVRLDDAEDLSRAA